jgi:hypothetical protein
MHVHLMSNNHPMVFSSNRSTTPLWRVSRSPLVCFVVDIPQVWLSFRLCPDAWFIMPHVRLPDSHARVILPIKCLERVVTSRNGVYGLRTVMTR